MPNSAMCYLTKNQQHGLKRLHGNLMKPTQQPRLQEGFLPYCPHETAPIGLEAWVDGDTPS